MTDETGTDRWDHPAGEARGRLSVGVTGHRPHGLVDADIGVLRTRVREVLDQIAARAGATTRTVVSPLAEGADRLVAREAINAGYQLICPLPFPRDEYARDFHTAASRAEYVALLDQATSVIELNGSRETPEQGDAAYAAAGDYLILHADVLVAIWDEQQARGNGGTGDVVGAALDAGLPVVCISSRAPHSTGILARAPDGMRIHAPISELSTFLNRRATP